MTQLPVQVLRARVQLNNRRHSNIIKLTLVPACTKQCEIFQITIDPDKHRGNSANHWLTNFATLTAFIVSSAPDSSTQAIDKYIFFYPARMFILVCALHISLETVHYESGKGDYS